jgi:hypothetical protein
LRTFIQRCHNIGAIQGLEEADTLNMLFDCLEDHVSFLNYDILQYIQDEFCPDSEDPNLKYTEHLKNFIKRSQISEFSFLPGLTRFHDSRLLTFLIDCDRISKTAGVIDLKNAMAKVLNLLPGSLRIIDIAALADELGEGFGWEVGDFHLYVK